MKNLLVELAIIFILVLLGILFLWNFLYSILSGVESMNPFAALGNIFLPFCVVVSYSISLFSLPFLLKNVIRKKGVLLLIHLFSINFLFLHEFKEHYISSITTKSFYETLDYYGNLQISWFFSANAVTFIYFYFRKTNIIELYIEPDEE